MKNTEERLAQLEKEVRKLKQKQPINEDMTILEMIERLKPLQV